MGKGRTAFDRPAQPSRPTNRGESRTPYCDSECYRCEYTSSKQGKGTTAGRLDISPLDLGQDPLSEVDRVGTEKRYRPDHPRSSLWHRAHMPKIPPRNYLITLAHVSHHAPTRELQQAQWPHVATSLNGLQLRSGVGPKMGITLRLSPHRFSVASMIATSMQSCPFDPL